MLPTPSINSPPLFAPRVIRIGRTLCAVDYALSNITLVLVDGGYVLVDTGPSVASARAIRAALECDGRGQLKAVIYTHSHMDHVLGTTVFHSPGVPIYAQERFFDEVRFQRRLGQANLERGTKQFGLRLTAEQATTCGIGPPLRLDDGPLAPLLLPTETFRDALDLEIGGVRFELRAAPGETHDHLFIWLPDDRILIAGDNLYKAFPNLAALRGSTPRPVEEWVKSLDRMRSLQPAPETLILGHTEPIQGAPAIGEALLAYRDGIAFVHHSVVRMINQGSTPDEMVRAIRLPPHLQGNPYLQEVYGTVATSVRGIYAGYVGWFDGNASNVEPLSAGDLGGRLLPRFGGRREVLKLIDGALAANDPRWAAWLADLLLAAAPRDHEARGRKAQALLKLAETTTNPLCRHWYLHDGAAFAKKERAPEPVLLDLNSVEPIPIEEILGQLPYRLRSERTIGMEMTVGYDFTDSGKQFTFIIRKGVGELVPALIGTPDLVFRATELDFKRAFVARTLLPRSREFWQRIQFVLPSGGLTAPFRILRQLLRLDACLVQPNVVSVSGPTPSPPDSEGESMATGEPPRQDVKTSGDSQKLRFYHMRNWLGMPFGVWMKTLAANRFAVSPGRILQAVRMSVFTPFNSLFRWVDHLVYSRRVREAPAPKPPLFIVGHWRTGTTLLHELMILDDQFSYATTYQVMTPHHFLLTGRFLPYLLGHALPERRPMDNMQVGFDKPQEDEFALCNLGVQSPYLKWAFPNRDGEWEKFLDLEGLSDAEVKRWTDALVGFVRRLSYHDPRRVILKSPTHTARVKQLSAAFPGAQFIHITRDPRVVFPSTVHTWKQLWDSMGFQVPNFRGIEDYVLDTFDRMYKSFDAARPLLDAKHLYEIRYEDLVKDPVEEVRKIYDRLGLEGFERVRPKLVQYQSDKKDYKTNRHELPDELRERIAERWRGYIERYGYAQ